MSKSALTPFAQLDPAEAWKPWKPDQWNLKWAAHFYRRAAFGAPPYDMEKPDQSTWSGLQQAVKQGFDATLEQILAGGPGLAEFTNLMDTLAPQMASAQEFASEYFRHHLQGWWLYRMLYTPHPFLERMTLFWHNHFATSVAKVRQLPLMLKQNQLIRKHALGKFRPFLLEMSRDPAMLIWLDSNSNVKGKPNENYARELMELFSLGVGNYTEHDVREAARAFTGWHAVGQEFVFNAAQHDDGAKTVLGQSGAWDGGDIVRIVLDQPAAARFLARKLYRHFISEPESPPDPVLETLADLLRRSDYDIAAIVRTILSSRLFFSEYAYRQRIKGPVEFVVGLARSLDARIQIQNLTYMMDDLGQALFAPPNVKGWDGGKAWLNSATLLARHNLAWGMIGGENPSFQELINPATLVKQHGGTNPEQQVAFLLDLFLQGDVTAKARQKLVDFLKQDDPKEKAWETRLREIAHTILLMPEYQLA
jgi:uncharacterized protein (DUF1800 family)